MEENININSGFEAVSMTSDTSKLTKMLGKDLYRNQYSFIREVVSNATDSQRRAGVKRNIEVHVNDDSFKVKDYGVSMTRDEFRAKIGVVGDSDKNDEAISIGGYGIGTISFSKFINTCHYICIKNKKKFTGTLKEGLSGQLLISTTEEEDCDEENSVTFFIDKSVNITEVKKILLYFDDVIIYNNGNILSSYLNSRFTHFKTFCTVKTNSYALKSSSPNQLTVISDSVRYDNLLSIETGLTELTNNLFHESENSLHENQNKIQDFKKSLTYLINSALYTKILINHSGFKDYVNIALNFKLGELDPSLTREDININIKLFENYIKKILHFSLEINKILLLQVTNNDVVINNTDNHLLKIVNIEEFNGLFKIDISNLYKVLKIIKSLYSSFKEVEKIENDLHFNIKTIVSILRDKVDFENLMREIGEVNFKIKNTLNPHWLNLENHIFFNFTKNLQRTTNKNIVETFLFEKQIRLNLTDRTVKNYKSSFYVYGNDELSKIPEFYSKKNLNNYLDEIKKNPFNKENIYEFNFKDNFLISKIPLEDFKDFQKKTKEKLKLYITNVFGNNYVKIIHLNNVDLNKIRNRIKYYVIKSSLQTQVINSTSISNFIKDEFEYLTGNYKDVLLTETYIENIKLESDKNEKEQLKKNISFVLSELDKYLEDFIKTRSIDFNEVEKIVLPEKHEEKVEVEQKIICNQLSSRDTSKEQVEILPHQTNFFIRSWYNGIIGDYTLQNEFNLSNIKRDKDDTLNITTISYDNFLNKSFREKYNKITKDEKLKINKKETVKSKYSGEFKDYINKLNYLNITNYSKKLHTSKLFISVENHPTHVQLNDLFISLINFDKNTFIENTKVLSNPLSVLHQYVFISLNLKNLELFKSFSKQYITELEEELIDLSLELNSCEEDDEKEQLEIELKIINLKYKINMLENIKTIDKLYLDENFKKFLSYGRLTNADVSFIISLKENLNFKELFKDDLLDFSNELIEFFNNNNLEINAYNNLYLNSPAFKSFVEKNNLTHLNSKDQVEEYLNKRETLTEIFELYKILNSSTNNLFKGDEQYKFYKALDPENNFIKPLEEIINKREEDRIKAEEAIKEAERLKAELENKENTSEDVSKEVSENVF